MPEYHFGWLVGEDEVGRVPPAFLAYDIAQDVWRDLPQPPGRRWPSYLIATEDRLIGYAESHDRGRRPDLVFDPSTEAWTRLPADPLGRAYDRSIVWTGSELVLIGVPHPGEPWIARAAAFDPAAERWRTLPSPGISGLYPAWFWSSGRVVNPSFDPLERGDLPIGAMLHVSSSSWEPLPDPPSEYGEYRDLLVGGEETVVSTAGWAFHVPSGSWEPLTRPFGDHDQEAASVWAGDRLVVWGGYRDGRFLSQGWAWVPPWA